MGLVFSGQAALLGSLCLGAALEGIVKSVLKKSCAHSPDRRFSYAVSLHDLLIAPALLAFEQDLCMLDATGRCLTTVGERF
jgi:hypothetical protein